MNENKSSNEAEIIARVTGSVCATVTHERRLPSGELVVDDVATFDRELDKQSDKLSVICDECGERHQATYSHEGRFNEGAIFAVVCTVDDLTDFYTSERVERDAL